MVTDDPRLNKFSCSRLHVIFSRNDTGVGDNGGGGFDITPSNDRPPVSASGVSLCSAFFACAFCA